MRTLPRARIVTVARTVGRNKAKPVLYRDHVCRCGIEVRIEVKDWRVRRCSAVCCIAIRNRARARAQSHVRACRRLSVLHSAAARIRLRLINGVTAVAYANATLKGDGTRAVEREGGAIRVR